MPVVRIYTSRFSKMVGEDRRKVIARLPYVGLDIESVEKDSVRVEYSPNRPDFGTDFGIARALRGLMGKEVGLPAFPASPSGAVVTVDRRLSSVRPYIACAVAKGLRLDDEDIRQIISLQEDLHNGLGRRRKVAAIGIHDMDGVSLPLAYRAVDSSFSFVPLGGTEPSTVASILSDTTEGRLYGPALRGKGLYPVITDSKGVVLSFPPIINGDATKVTAKTKNVFVDVTSTDKKAGDDVLAIVTTTLGEAGARLGTVSVKYSVRTEVTPDLAPTQLKLDQAMVRSVLGMDLSAAEIAACLRRSRLGPRGRKVLAPRYRLDLMHPVDLAEEIALGYGFDRIVPAYPPSKRPGSFNRFEEYLDSVSTVMAGMGMIELMTFELTDRGSLYDSFRRPDGDKLQVKDPKSLEHSVLRDALIPSMMATLRSNIRSDYPQRVFEIGRVYSRSKGGVSESMRLGCLIAHSQASFTEAKMYLESLCLTIGGVNVIARAGEHWAFSPGRCASVGAGESTFGYVGELRPDAVAAFGLGVPVSGFELDLSLLYERLK
ncbi:MAG TPA: phenylalanine--tRNA ligase subunit beta [Nitrososphaerales archaeon]|nr:phenylalanine--tRNA ligase subunit beta [Nitrososphaerales archaeon]